MKRCPECGESKSLEEFYRSKNASDGDSGYCKPCSLSRQREWRAKDADHLKAYERSRPKVDYETRRAAQLRREYGIEPQDFDRMVSDQGGRCAVCDEQPEPIRGRRIGLFVDHCHDTGEVRGLLCSRCNTGIGQMRDDPRIMRAAIAYVERVSA